MKKLSIYQKAQRYDEAIEVARKIKNGEPINVPDGTLIPVAIFPELKDGKENEDEKIRKAISDILLIDSDEIRKILDANDVLMRDIDDWLEKQGDANKEYIKINKEAKGGYRETLRAVHPSTKEQRDTLMKAIADAGYIFDIEKKELKKIEQKST